MTGGGVGMVGGLVIGIVAATAGAVGVAVGRSAGIVVAAADSAGFGAEGLVDATAGGVRAFPAEVATLPRGRSQRRTG